MILLNNEEIALIFRENYSSLCRFLETIVGRDHLAQDIAQESFLRLCRQEFGEISAAEIRFWLFRVARNLALNEIGRIGIRSKLWNRVRDFFDRRQSHPEELLAASESKKIMTQLLAQLPEHQRSALLLREMEEMSYREIALTLNISENKVRIDIYRARRKLQALWFSGGKTENDAKKDKDDEHERPSSENKLS